MVIPNERTSTISATILFFIIQRRCLMPIPNANNKMMIVIRKQTPKLYTIGTIPNPNTTLMDTIRKHTLKTVKSNSLFIGFIFLLDQYTSYFDFFYNICLQWNKSQSNWIFVSSLVYRIIFIYFISSMIAFSIGSIDVYRYGIFYFVTFLIGYFFFRRIAKKNIF